MKKLFIAAVVISVLGLPLTGAAQEILEPPANWGELAEPLVVNWGIEAAEEPSGGNASINALNLIGIGNNAYNLIMGIEFEDLFPTEADGYDPENWLPEQELTPDFICKLKAVVWAAAYSGLIPYYEVPRPSSPEVPLTPEEEALANEVARVAVEDLIMTAQRDAPCDSGGGGQGMCWVCTGFIAPICGWVPCP